MSENLEKYSHPNIEWNFYAFKIIFIQADTLLASRVAV